ncbi:MAG: DUF308 domain-containing protein [Microbacteriaceae bacterium]|nr:MAG: DUF308 domain-containing protein [Microbacteriaceae bacterium]
MMPASFTPAQPLSDPKPGFSLQLHRGETLLIAIVGIIVGIMALIWQDATLVLVGVLFGVYLMVSGVVRLAAAIVSRHVGAGHRWLIGLLGVVIFAVGVLCVIDPLQSIVLLAVVIGVGWIVGGAIDLIGAAAGTIFPRWFGVISGLFALFAGLLALTLPVLTLQAFIIVGATLLIAVSLMSMLTVPRRATTAAW